MRCPACKGRNIQSRIRYLMLYCISCNTSFHPHESWEEPPAPVPRKPRKSGVIAGPVFRRGFRWGAGY